jgi:hypothetical protein
MPKPETKMESQTIDKRNPPKPQPKYYPYNLKSSIQKRPLTAIPTKSSKITHTQSSKATPTITEKITDLAMNIANLSTTTKPTPTDPPSKPDLRIPIDKIVAKVS